MGPAQGFQAVDNDVEEGAFHSDGEDGENDDVDDFDRNESTAAPRFRSALEAGLCEDPSADHTQLSSHEGGVHEQEPELFYYVNVPDANESTHEVQNMVVNIDPGFESSLQEQHQEHNFASFLALPEVIPARKRKRQQPVLDFTKSKILTLEEYITACEQLLAKRQENEAAAKRRAAERAANKESRRREKEERIAGINERKAQRQAKRLEKERLQAEKRAGGGQQGRRQPPANNIDLDSPEGGTTMAIHGGLSGNGEASMAIHGGASAEHGHSQWTFTTSPSVEQGPRHSFNPFFNPQLQLQLPSSSTAFQPPSTRLWPSPPPMFYNPMLMTSFFPPTTACFNASESNGHAG